MPNADFFAAIGFLTRRDFLDRETCRRLRDAVRKVPSSPATVRDEVGSSDEVDRASRSTDRAKVDSEAVELIEQRLASLIPEVGQHYGTPLTGVRSPQFLVYRKGDFFGLHSDGADSEGAPRSLRARRVSAVIFLNAEGDPTASDAYRGGALTFYGLFERNEGKALGFPLQAEEGLLVTFPADVAHEVRPVKEGERYTIVSWFVDEGSAESLIEANG